MVPIAIDVPTAVVLYSIKMALKHFQDILRSFLPRMYKRKEFYVQLFPIYNFMEPDVR